MFDFLKNASDEAVQQIMEDSAKKAIKDTGVNVEDLSVKIEDGVATVRGAVDSEDDKRTVIDAVKGVKDIKKVRHALKVEGNEEEGEEDSEGLDNGVQAVYVVRPGDSLWLIADKFYGNGSIWEKISEANNLMEKRGRKDLIHPGDEIIVPKLDD